MMLTPGCYTECKGGVRELLFNYIGNFVVQHLLDASRRLRDAARRLEEQAPSAVHWMFL